MLCNQDLTKQVLLLNHWSSLNKPFPTRNWAKYLLKLTLVWFRNCRVTKIFPQPQKIYESIWGFCHRNHSNSLYILHFWCVIGHKRSIPANKLLECSITTLNIKVSFYMQCLSHDLLFLDRVKTVIMRINFQWEMISRSGLHPSSGRKK